MKGKKHPRGGLSSLFPFEIHAGSSRTTSTCPQQPADPPGAAAHVPQQQGKGLRWDEASSSWQTPGCYVVRSNPASQMGVEASDH